MAVLTASQRLDRIDWDFPGTGTKRTSVHTLHWFPGNFIPQIPAALIQILSKPGDLVLDPFGGSGTTAIEALRLGRRVWISDRMSASVLITRAKLAFLNGALDAKRRSALLSALTFEHHCISEQFGKNDEGSSLELNYWYASETLSQLRFLWQLIEAEPKESDREVLVALFSNVLFDCAAPGTAVTASGLQRRHHWGWIADNVRPRSLTPHNAIALFRTRMMTLDQIARLEMLYPEATVVQQDARSLGLQSETVDAVITSPPYVSVIDYTHANRLLYAWMGWSMQSEREHEIGARYRRGRVNVVDDYKLQMRMARDEIHRVLRPGGVCAIVIGESKRFPGTAQQVMADFSEVMPRFWGPAPRFPSRRRVSDRAARDPVEFVCVFQKA